MTTGEKASPPEATPLPTETPGVPDSKEASEQTPAKAEAPETQIAALRAENEKLEGRQKSLQQTLSKAQAESASFQQLRDDMDDLRLEVSGFPDLMVEGFKTVASGNSEDMAGVLSVTQGRIRAEKESRVRESEYKGLLRRMQDYAEDADSVAAWSIEVRRQNETKESQSLDRFREILGTAQATKFESDLAAKDAEIVAKDTELKEARGKFEKEYEVNDVNTGSASGGGDVEITEATIDNLMSRIDEFSPEKRTAIRDKYRRLMHTGSFE
jgi:hypothetical protein